MNIDKEFARQQVEQKRKQKYKIYLEKNYSREEILNEIIFDLKKNRDGDEKAITKEAVEILPKVLETGWSEKLRISLKNLRSYGKEPYQIWYESKKELNCCEWRRKHIYHKEKWDLEDYYRHTSWVLENKDEGMLQSDYRTWVALFFEKKCSECNYFAEKINTLQKIKKSLEKLEKDKTKEINLSTKRTWIFRHDRECSDCPVTLYAVTTEDNRAKEHIFGYIEENAFKFLAAEVLVFNCPKCNQKWATIGEIPAHVRLAHKINNGEKFEGSKLTCYAC